MHRDSPRTKLAGTTLLGALLMFTGWLLAIVPAFRHISGVSLEVVVVVAIAAYGLVLVPSSLEILRMGGPGRKRGAVPLLVTMVPAAVLFTVVIVALPIATLYRALAVVTEVAGMSLSGRDWLIASRRDSS